LWYDDFREFMPSKEYNKNLFLISSFENIEVIYVKKEFWSIIKNCPKIIDTPEKTSFHLFKYPIRP